MGTKEPSNLLTDYLEPIIHEGQKPDSSRPLRLWLVDNFSAEELDTSILDEAKILPRMPAMLAHADRVFPIQPAGLHELRDLYTEIKIEESTAYLLKALETQRKKLTRFLQTLHHGKPIEKELRAVDRELLELEARIKYTQTTEYMQDFLSLIELRARNRLKKTRRGQKFTIDSLAGTHEYMTAYIDTLSSEKKKRRADIDRYDQLEESHQVLLNRLNIQRRVHQVLADTSENLLALHGVTTQKEPMNAPVVKRKGPRKDPTQPRPSKVKGVAPSHASTDHVTRTSQTQLGENLNDQFVTSLESLRTAMQVAAKTTQKIRVLAVNKDGKIYSNWEDLFSVLGFKGKIELVAYSDLDVTSDTISPVVVLPGFHTHHNRWDKKRFKVCPITVRSPKLLQNYLEQD